MLFTIGHSNHPWQEFSEVLRRNGITLVADIRRFPSSRKWPHYDREALERALAEDGIRYVHLPQLGGRRNADGSDANAGWEHKAFRGYADYARTPEFQEGLRQLMGFDGRIAIMCSEAVPWRCHRRIVADHLVVRGREVYDIIGAAEPRPHRLTPFAHWQDGELTYPSAQTTLE